MATTHDLYLNEYGGTTANLKVRGNVAAGNHAVEITATVRQERRQQRVLLLFRLPLAASSRRTFRTRRSSIRDVSLAIDFDTDHGYKKPPAWHLWQLQKLGFKGHADVYMGVFWNNKRQRIGATYPYATVVFSGTPARRRRGVDLTIGGHHSQSRHRVRRDAPVHRVPDARHGQRDVLRRVGR